MFKPVTRSCSRAQLATGAAGTIPAPWRGAKCARQPVQFARYVLGAAAGPDHGPAVTGYVSNVRNYLNAQPAWLSHSVVPWARLTFVSGTIHALGIKNPAAAGLDLKRHAPDRCRFRRCLVALENQVSPDRVSHMRPKENPAAAGFNSAAQRGANSPCNFGSGGNRHIRIQWCTCPLRH